MFFSFPGIFLSWCFLSNFLKESSDSHNIPIFYSHRKLITFKIYNFYFDNLMFF